MRSLMTKLRLSFLACLIPLFAGDAFAADTISQSFKNGEASGYIRLFHILHGQDNGFDPNTGSSIGGKLKYVTDSYKGLRAGAAFYTAGDTGLTDDDEQIGHGLFLAADLSHQAVLGEAYVEYALSKSLLRTGRQKLDTPMTTKIVTLVPDLFYAHTLTCKDIPNTELMLSHVDKMAFGTRSICDFSLIGEFTKTAGVAISPMNIRGEFRPIESMIGATDETAGITALGAVYDGIPSIRLQLWDYIAYDIHNIIYAQANYKRKLNAITAGFGAQILHQHEIGDELANIGDDATMWGIKGALGYKRASVYAAFNSSSDGKILNAWGGDPAFTSTIFSRNAYRADVDAYKIGGKYTVMKGLSLKLEYADYGQSRTRGGNLFATLDPSDDATELDFMVVYKPVKNLTLKAFAAFRTSEYDRSASGGGGDTQKHYRLIAAYNF